MTTYPATYCPDCGHELGTRHVEGRDRQFCSACERVVWRNPAPGAGVAVVGPDGVLLTQRDIEPGVGEWAVPGGHIELEESPQAAAVRELEEEAGVRVHPDDLVILDAFSTSPFDGKYVVSIRFGARIEDVGGTPTAGPEVQTVEWFTPAEFAASDAVFHEPHDEQFERAWNRLRPDADRDED